jgi:hypothetical protein
MVDQVIAAPASGLNRRRLVLGAGHLIVVAAIAAAVVVGLGLVRDPEGPARLYAFLLDLLGQSTAAAGLREDGIDPLHAKLTIMVIALAIGVGGVWALYAGLNSLVDLLGPTWSRRVRPYMFIGPAVIMLLAYLVIPAVATIVASFTAEGAPEDLGYVLTSPEMWLAFRNNIIWMVVGTAGSVGIGLAVAALFDRIKREALAKVFIFLPLAISMVGASVIWRFMYAWQPPGEPQIGLVNAVWTAAGNDPVALMQVSSPPVNTMALIVIDLAPDRLRDGHLSAALKGVRPRSSRPPAPTAQTAPVFFGSSCR